MAPNPILRAALLYPFITFSLLLNFFFLFNGPALFSNWDELNLDKFIVAFLLMQVGAIAIARKNISQLPLPVSLAWFVGGALASGILFALVFRNVGIQQPFPVVGALFSVIAFQLVVASAEEAMFRGVFVRRTGNKATEAISVLIGALAFAGFHYAAYSSLGVLNPITLLYPFMFGLGMGYLFLKTRSLSVCIAIHWLHNLTLLGVNFFGLVGF